MDKDHYDQAATVFSPDGRVYQVEYAREAIKRGGLAMGIRFRDGILFTIDKSIFSPLVEEDNLEKFFKVTSTIGAAASGLIADARVLIDILRDKAQNEKRRYGDEPDIHTLVEWVSRIYEVYTRYEGVRPFGTAIIIGGSDPSGFHLFETDPSGVFQERRATAIGKGSRTAMDILEKKHDLDISKEQAIALAFDILKSTLVERPQDIPKGEELHIITKDGFERIDLDEEGDKVKELLEKVSAASKDLPDSSAEVKEVDIRSFLEEIKGLKKNSMEAILNIYPDMESLKKTSTRDLMKIEGVGRVTAKRILEALGNL
jgi:proteasome alpha subunit